MLSPSFWMFSIYCYLRISGCSIKMHSFKFAAFYNSRFVCLFFGEQVLHITYSLLDPICFLMSTCFVRRWCILRKLRLLSCPDRDPAYALLIVSHFLLNPVYFIEEHMIVTRSLSVQLYESIYFNENRQKNHMRTEKYDSTFACLKKHRLLINISD